MTMSLTQAISLPTISISIPQSLNPTHLLHLSLHRRCPCPCHKSLMGEKIWQFFLVKDCAVVCFRFAILNNRIVIIWLPRQQPLRWTTIRKSSVVQIEYQLMSLSSSACSVRDGVISDVLISFENVAVMHPEASDPSKNIFKKYDIWWKVSNHNVASHLLHWLMIGNAVFFFFSRWDVIPTHMVHVPYMHAVLWMACGIKYSRGAAKLTYWTAHVTHLDD